jgi:hypothetical protein
MSRQYTIYRRREELVSLILPRTDKNLEYRFLASGTLNGSYEEFETFDSKGLRKISRSGISTPSKMDLVGNSFKDKVLFSFNPKTYNNVHSHIDDGKQFYVKVQTRKGFLQGQPWSDINDSVPHLMVPYTYSYGDYPLIISDSSIDAPNKENATGLILPGTFYSCSISNTGSNPLIISLGKSEYLSEEYEIDPGDKLESLVLSFDSFYVRGNTSFKISIVSKNDTFGY